ncbi:MAG: hypothetical protein NVSMB62_23920 [Acidobacteriaceae bacterium]
MRIKERRPDTVVVAVQSHPDLPKLYPSDVHLCNTAPEEIIAVCRKLVKAANTV